MMKPKTHKLDKYRNNVPGSKGFRHDNGNQAFDKKEPCRSEKKLDTSNNSGMSFTEGYDI